MALVLKKNQIRVAVLKFHRAILEILSKYPDGFRLHEFERETELIANEIKQEFRSSKDKDTIRKVLKGAKKIILDAAIKSVRTKKIRAEMFFENYFGGKPLDNGWSSEEPYDLVIDKNANTVEAWIFSPNIAEGLNNYEIMNCVKNDFNKDCSAVITKYPVAVEDVEMVSFTVKDHKQPNTQIIFDQKSITETNEIIDNKTDVTKQKTKSSEVEYIGRALHNEEQGVVMKEVREDWEIYGFIRQKYISFVFPTDIVVFESDDKKTTVLASVVKFLTKKIHRGGREHRFSELDTVAAFRPIVEINDGKTSEFSSKDLDEYQIRKPTADEILCAYHAPSDGLPLGSILDSTGKVDFYYPFKPDSENLADTIYRSVFIFGDQGGGKTTGIKYLIQALTRYDKIEPSKRPAIIILDGESGKNSFRELIPNSLMKKETQEYLSKHGIGDVRFDVYTLSSDPTVSDSTLSIRELSYEDLPILLPDLEAKTEGIMLQILKLTFEKIQKMKETPTIERIREIAMQEARTYPLIYPIQRPAIGRALNSLELDMFNQKNKQEISTDILCEPGKISVINTNKLDITRKRVTELYIRKLLDNFKMQNDSHEFPGILLVTDEAEQIFPKKPPKRDKEYVERILTKAKDIADRGRKRLYGQIIVSHHPEEVSPDIVDLANTTIAFRCSAADSWIAKKYGRRNVARIKELADGETLINVNIGTREQRPISAIPVYFPDVGKTKEN